MNHLTTMGWFHFSFAMFGIVIGAVQLLRRKGDRIHRALGYAYVYGMIVADGTALAMYRFTGSFNVFHALAIVNLVCIFGAMLPLLQSPRPVNWLMRHYRWITGSYIGPVAAGATQLIIRVLPTGSRTELWIVAAVVILSATVVGTSLIRRNRPRQLQRVEPAIN